jgi:hypothetical protein
MTQIIWILGAGFSRSLGAPLLADLFTSESARRVTLHYPREMAALKVKPDELAEIFWHGAYGFPHASPTERRWEHAEEFIEQIELATLPEARVRRNELTSFMRRVLKLKPALSRDVERLEREVERYAGNIFLDIKASALRVLAAEVCCFLHQANPRQERWVT